MARNTDSTSFIYAGRQVKMKSGATGIRFKTLDDANNNRNPLWKGESRWRKAPYEMHFVTIEDVLHLSARGKNTRACERKQ